MKPDTQNRKGGQCQKNKKWKNLNCKEASFSDKRSISNILKWPRK